MILAEGEKRETVSIYFTKVKIAFMESTNDTITFTISLHFLLKLAKIRISLLKTACSI